MGVLEGLKPERVFYWFERISEIPRGSGDMDKISGWLMKFAEEKGLGAERDEAGNVIIRKGGSPGCEQAKTLILQGHCDMVCEKKDGSAHDFRTEPLELRTDGEKVWAEATTLGGDDGIAVAMMLAVLEDETLLHPPLEAVFTTDEEIGMLGASAFDFSRLEGRRMLNLDSEEEGILLAGCAGGMTAHCSIPVRYNEVSAAWYQVTVHGLAGGHSGSEIDKNRANSSIMAGRFLYCLDRELPFALAELEGGQKDNAIPRKTRMVVGIAGEDEAELMAAAAKLESELRREYRGSDGGITITVEKKGEGSCPALDPVSTQKTIFWLNAVPNGVAKMSGEIPGLVETSCNLGILALTPAELSACISVRSSIGSARDALGEKICYLTEFLGGDCHTEGVYPAWEYRETSPFRELVREEYEKLYGKSPKVEVIHAGLECGLFYEGLPGLECVSMGPDIMDIHTTEETLSVPSVERSYKLVCRILEAAAR